MDLNLDIVSADCIYGWALSPNGIRQVTVNVDGSPIGAARLGFPRPDVGKAYPHTSDSENAGFLFSFADHEFANSVSSIEVGVEDGTGAWAHRKIDRVPTISIHASSAMLMDDRPPGPFPADVQGLLADLDDRFASPENWTPSLVEDAVAGVVSLIQRGSRGLAALSSYLMYLNKLDATFNMIAKRFPQINLTASASAKDLVCAPSVPAEMLAISNHLYVLHSYGLTGALTEFGCFKGFSTSCLSHACHALGIELHVFDSFGGLPPSESSYYSAGDFAGSFDEVVENVSTFGHAEVVKFHRGFFSDSLPTYDGSPIMIWMDVDLFSSATDVMGLLPRLSARSVVFTHDCAASNFLDGAIISDPLPDQVLAPVVTATIAQGLDPIGKFITGATGAVWDRKKGIPPLGIDAIRRMLDAAA